MLRIIISFMEYVLFLTSLWRLLSHDIYILYWVFSFFQLGPGAILDDMEERQPVIDLDINLERLLVVAAEAGLEEGR